MLDHSYRVLLKLIVVNSWLGACQLPRPFLLRKRQNRISPAQDALRVCELQQNIFDTPDLLRLILLTRCCLELHNHNFQKAWRCFQAADILKLVGDSRYSVSRDTVVRSQRLWIRQLADLQHTAEDN